MNTDRLPAIMLRNGDRIANRMVLVDPNAILSLDRHIGLFIAAAPKQIVAYAQIFAFDLRWMGHGCILDLLLLFRRHSGSVGAGGDRQSGRAGHAWGGRLRSRWWPSH